MCSWTPIWETRYVDEEPNVSLVRVDGLAPDVPYAYAAFPAAGRRLLFTAGASPLNAGGEIVSPGDLAAQTRQVMSNLEGALGAADAGLGDVVKTTVYVASNRREDLALAWQVIRECFGDHDAPSTLLGVATLGYPNQLVEVEAVASVPDLRRHS
jgi:enamine deaminase RidA (YjgF/YER057c/UK114 family)